MDVGVLSWWQVLFLAIFVGLSTGDKLGKIAQKDESAWMYVLLGAYATISAKLYVAAGGVLELSPL